MNLRTLLKRDTSRKLMLIETLYFSRSPLSSEQLTDILNCSLPVLLNDIHFINADNELYSIIKEKGLYYLTYDEEKGIDSLYAYIVRNSVEMQLLEQLLYERQSNINEMADYLYISLSNAQRSIKHLAQHLKKWGIYLYHRPLRLEGNEVAIRHLYYHFFQEKREDFEDMVPSHEFLLTAAALMDSFTEVNHFPKSLILQLRIGYNFFVSLQRIKNGHFFTEKTLDSHGVSLPDSLLITKSIGIFQKNFDLRLSGRVLRECFWLFFGDFMIFTDTQYARCIDANHKLQEAYTLHEELVAELEKLMGQQFSLLETQALVNIFVNAHFLYQPDLEFITILSEAKRDFLKGMLPTHARSIEKIRNKTTDFFAQKGVPISEGFIVNYTYLTITSVPDCLRRMEQQEPQLQVLVISDLAPSQEYFLRSVMKLKLRGNLQLHFLEDILAPRHHIPKTMTKYDVILTTRTLQAYFTDCPVIAVETYPTEHTLAKVQQLINQLSAAKEQTLA